MSYNIIDLIRKAAEISENMIQEYERTSKECNEVPSIEILCRVFINKEKNKIQYYEKLRECSKKEELKDIECFIYDKVSSLIAQFNKKLGCKKINGTKDLIKCTININEDIRALFVDIRGRLIQKKGDSDSYEFKILTQIINLQEEYIDELKNVY